MPAGRLIRDSALPAAENMARDEALLYTRMQPTLRLYQWNKPSLSLGWFQDPALLPWQSVLERSGEMVRRPTGGKAILHEHEWTWSLCMPETGMFSQGPGRAIEILHESLAATLSPLVDPGEVRLRREASWPSDRPGSAWCFEDSSPLDLGLHGRKLMGSAARRKKGWILFHGSLVRTPPRETPNIAGLEVARTDPRPCQALIQGIEQATGLAFLLGEWNLQETGHFAALREKYEDPEFTWARCPHGRPTELLSELGR